MITERRAGPHCDRRRSNLSHSDSQIADRPVPVVRARWPKAEIRDAIGPV